MTSPRTLDRFLFRHRLKTGLPVSGVLINVRKRSEGPSGSVIEGVVKEWLESERLVRHLVPIGTKVHISPVTKHWCFQNDPRRLIATDKSYFIVEGPIA